MRVLLITPTLPDPDGRSAIPVLIDAELRGLSALHEVTLVTAVGDESWEAAAASALRASGADAILADRRVPADARRHRRRQAERALRYAFDREPWRTVWFGTQNLQTAVAHAIATRGPFDVISQEDSATGWLGLPAGVPTVFTEYEVRRRRPVAWNELGGPGNWGRWAFSEQEWGRWPSFQRRLWRRFALLQTFTTKDADSVRELDPVVSDRIRVNPFGVELPPPGAEAAEVPGTLLFTGHFTHYPNVDAAVWLAREIMPRVLERAPQARLRIVGSAPTEEILALAGPGVDVVGEVATIQPELARASLILAPIRVGGGMRMKVLNAMASGRPVVTTLRGSEGFDETGVTAPLVLAETAEAFAERTAELLNDPARRHELGRAGRSFVESVHSPLAWARRLTGVYEEAIERSHATAGRR